MIYFWNIKLYFNKIYNLLKYSYYLLIWEIERGYNIREDIIYLGCWKIILF